MDKYSEIYAGDRYCLMCRHACPVGRVTRRETTTPHGWALLIFSAERGMIPWDEETVDLLYQCADCGLCQASCATRRPLPAAIVAARAQLVSRGKAPQSVAAVEKNLREHGNAWGRPAPSPAEGGSRWGLFVGETHFTRPQTVAAARKTLQALDADPVLLGIGRSSGGTAYSLGLWEAARRLAGQAVEQIRSVGVEVVFTLAKEDARTFTQVYPELEIQFPEKVRVVELVEFVAERFQEGAIKLRRKKVEAACYHDPCHSSRLWAGGSAARRLLEALTGRAPREMLWRRQLAAPCGAVGGLQWTQPQLAEDLARERLAEAREAGAQVLISEDPGCTAHLEQFAGGIRVVNLIELLSEQSV